jgi:hypothetical protein
MSEWDRTLALRQLNERDIRAPREDARWFEVGRLSPRDRLAVLGSRFAHRIEFRHPFDLGGRPITFEQLASFEPRLGDRADLTRRLLDDGPIETPRGRLDPPDPGCVPDDVLGAINEVLDDHRAPREVTAGVWDGLGALPGWIRRLPAAEVLGRRWYLFDVDRTRVGDIPNGRFLASAGLWWHRGAGFLVCNEVDGIDTDVFCDDDDLAAGLHVASEALAAIRWRPTQD